MIDYANNPLFDPAGVDLAHQWIEEFKKPMIRKGINFTRYYVGGIPPDEEQRYSTPECDDARNGIGAYGGLSFIIESGIRRKATDPLADLKHRVVAYMELFGLILDTAHKQADRITTLYENQPQKPGKFIATNYFWAKSGPQINQVQVIDTTRGVSRKIETANFMTELVIKKSVPAPTGYIIPSDATGLFTDLLNRHGLDFRILSESVELFVEPVRLIRVENTQDSVYQRYAGRQITKAEKKITKTFSTGSVRVNLDQEFFRKTIIVLEPNMLYGLYKYNEYAPLADHAGILPVYRIIEEDKLNEK
jgi:hypothetical protein